MKVKFFSILSAAIISCSAIIFVACDSATTNSILNTAGGVLGGGGTGTTEIPLTNDEVIKGLKEALTVGTNNSSGLASKLDGYYKNPALFIPFPPEAQKMKQKLTDLGMDAKIKEFEMSMNRAAETAAKDAAPIFVNAVTSMSIADGFQILKGGDTAATHYLREKTYAELISKFKPTVKSAMDKVEVTKYWNPLVTTYNKIPFIEKQNPDLDSYVTNLAAQGLFKLLLTEESKIRKDPIARVSDILKKVFGSKEAQGK
jgi:hypothetical protein